MSVSIPDDLLLIETLLWRRGEGLPLLARHLGRLTRSARALGFRCDVAAAEAAVSAAVSGAAAERLRVRLTLARDGTVTTTATAFEPVPPDGVWDLVVSDRRLEASDPLLRHKTSRRALYDGERARLLPSSGCEEVVFLNREARVADCGITCLYAADPAQPGVLRTPRLADGCLDSVLRAELIESGRVRATALTLDDLRTAPALFVGNALRGLIPARLTK